jgi:hypothetical protein
VTAYIKDEEAAHAHLETARNAYDSYVLFRTMEIHRMDSIVETLARSYRDAQKHYDTVSRQNEFKPATDRFSHSVPHSQVTAVSTPTPSGAAPVGGSPAPAWEGGRGCICAGCDTREEVDA